MKIHHLQCGQMHPLGLGPQGLICHCLLVETSRSGLVLIDTGLGAIDLHTPSARLPWAFRTLSRITRDPSHAAIAQVRALGFTPNDVRHIVLTHLDLDHTGGLVDFPHAQVHLHAHELAAAFKSPKSADIRYNLAMFAHNPRFTPYLATGEAWHGFSAVRPLIGLPPELALIPLAGHSHGHTAVALPRAGGGWLLHAGDAYFQHEEVHGPSRRCALPLRALQSFTETDRRHRLHNQDRLRELIRNNPIFHVFSSHDPREFPTTEAASAPR